MWMRTGVWIIAMQIGLCATAEPSVSPGPSSPAASAPGGVAAKKKPQPPLSGWEKKLAEDGKIGLQTGYVSAKRGGTEWRASNSTRIELAYRFQRYPGSVGLWALLQYGAFSVAPQLGNDGNTDAFVGRIEDFGTGVEVSQRFTNWLYFGQGVLGYQRALLADQAQVADSGRPPERSAYMQLKVGAGWIFLQKLEVGPFLAAERGLVTALETGLFLRASF